MNHLQEQLEPALELDILNDWPDSLVEVPAVLIREVLPNPTLIHLSGRDPRPLFVSVLLHGDEDVGLKAVQHVMANYRTATLPRSMSIFVGNVDAASQTKRTLATQLDYNRVWRGSELAWGAEHGLMQRVLSEMVSRDVAASVDLHNNSGRNPYYACICSMNLEHLQLAALFSHRVLYFLRPKGVQTQAFTPICPSITCECGPIGDAHGARAAAELIERVLALGEGNLRANLPELKEEVELFHTVATWRVRPDASLGFDSRADTDVFLRPDLDRLNFQRLEAGAELGQLLKPLAKCLQVCDEAGREVTDQFFQLDAEGHLQLKRATIPSMLTTCVDAIRLDCVGYFMEQLSTLNPPPNVCSAS